MTTVTPTPPKVKKHRSVTMSPDQLWVGILAIALVTIIMLASMIFSFNAITEAASWTGNPPYTHWLAAVFIDGAILTYTVSYAVFRWKQEPYRRTLSYLYLFTAISVAVNFAHTASFWKWDFSEIDAIYGVLIAVTAPIAALLSSEEVVRLAFARPKSPDSERAPEPVVESGPADTEPGSVDELERQFSAPSEPEPRTSLILPATSSYPRPVRDTAPERTDLVHNV